MAGRLEQLPFGLLRNVTLRECAATWPCQASRAPCSSGMRRYNPGTMKNTIMKLMAVALLTQAALVVAANSPSAAQAGTDFVSGQRYYTGDGVPQDYARAAQLFRRAGSNGHPYAQYMLALMLEHGYGVTADLAEAKLWYRRAAKLGDLRAQRRLQSLGETPLAPLTTETPRPLPPPASRPAPVAPAAEAPSAATQVQASAVAAAPALSLAPPAAPAAPAAPADAAPAESPTPVYAPPVALPPLAAYSPPPVAAPAAPPPADRRGAVAPTLRVVLPTEQLSPITAGAIQQYRDAMAAADYASALRALEQAREDGIPALGLDEPHTARELARLAVLAQDNSLARVYLQQAISLGAPKAQEAWTQLSAGAEATVIAELLID
jgi:TPR repeat protein